jgi:hypothetical protein
MDQEGDVPLRRPRTEDHFAVAVGMAFVFPLGGSGVVRLGVQIVQHLSQRHLIDVEQLNPQGLGLLRTHADFSNVGGRPLRLWQDGRLIRATRVIRGNASSMRAACIAESGGQTSSGMSYIVA